MWWVQTRVGGRRVGGGGCRCAGGAGLCVCGGGGGGGERLNGEIKELREGKLRSFVRKRRGAEGSLRPRLRLGLGRAALPLAGNGRPSSKLLGAIHFLEPFVSCPRAANRGPSAHGSSASLQHSGGDEALGVHAAGAMAPASRQLTCPSCRLSHRRQRRFPPPPSQAAPAPRPPLSTPPPLSARALRAPRCAETGRAPGGASSSRLSHYAFGRAAAPRLDRAMRGGAGECRGTVGLKAEGFRALGLKALGLKALGLKALGLKALGLKALGLKALGL
jgi:hypothetical protein